MAKVIVERPRWGHRHGHIDEGRKRPVTDDDGEELGFFARTNKRTKKTKMLNENLAPLRRFLAAQVGRPWDAVHSEICAHIRPSNTVQQHVLQHVPDFIATRVWREANGELWVHHGRWGRPMRLSECRVRLYVEPETGLVRRNPARR
jgi:hypothetical protein